MPKFSFPVWLQGTPEQQKADATAQAHRRASFGRGHLTEAEQLVSRGALLEETARGNLEQAFGVKGKEEERELAKAQLADSKAMQGRYAEAAEIHPDKDRRAHFRDIIKAIEMPDSERCDCPDTVAEFFVDETGKPQVHKPESRQAEKGGTLISVTPRFERGKIFSPVHNDVVSLIECQHCGHINARKPNSRLLLKNSLVNQNHQAIKSGAVRGVISDAQILK